MNLIPAKSIRLLSGQIKIGGKSINNGVMEFFADDHFSVCARQTDPLTLQNIEHPIHSKVLAAQTENVRKTGKKDEHLTRIDVIIPSDHVDYVIESTYESYAIANVGLSLKGIRICAGNGSTAERTLNQQTETVECLGCDRCEFAQQNGCKKISRMYFALNEHDRLSEVFIMRTGSAQNADFMHEFLIQHKALFGGKIAGLRVTLELEKFYDPKSGQPYMLIRPFLKGSLPEAFETMMQWRQKFMVLDANQNPVVDFEGFDNDRYTRITADRQGDEDTITQEILEYVSGFAGRNQTSSQHLEAPSLDANRDQRSLKEFVKDKDLDNSESENNTAESKEDLKASSVATPTSVVNEKSQPPKAIKTRNFAHHTQPPSNTPAQQLGTVARTQRVHAILNSPQKQGSKPSVI